MIPAIPSQSIPSTPSLASASPISWTAGFGSIGIAAENNHMRDQVNRPVDFGLHLDQVLHGVGPGPHDADYLFAQFVKLMRKAKNA